MECVKIDAVTSSPLDDILAAQKLAFKKQPYLSYQNRVENLNKLKAAVLTHKSELLEAMSKDFGNRAQDDSIIGDILTTVNGINYSVKKLKSWMKPERRHVGILFQPATARVEYQPLGVVGIMVPWNYPVFLSLGPLTTALAAGNRAMLKLSEYTPATNKVLIKLLATCFGDNEVAVIEGDASIAADFSSLKFDHLFFTGSTQVGKYVMQAAAKNLVPVTLELGGKSPAIIAPDIEIDTAVERLILGKTLNSGQTCVAPDYLFVPAGKKQAFIESLKRQYTKMFPTVTGNDDCTCIVNTGQYQRLLSYLEDAKAKGAEVISLVEATHSADARQLPLTLVDNVTDDMKIMQDEIFGPLLPVMEYQDISEVVDYIAAQERPLALYLYSFDKTMQDYILSNTHSGGVCINETAFHVAVEDLPFGGVGASGMGNYHGIEGFKTFSHAKAVFSRGKVSLTSMLFPPYGKLLHKLMYKLFIR